MTIRTVHQVISKSGSMIGEYMNLKHAKDMDNRTDVLYYVAEIIEAVGVDEVTSEKIAEALLDDGGRQEILVRLKSVKDIPTE
ncbi:MAG: hypothetical protein V7752_20650 [Halopseudomonas sp.]